MESDVLNVKSNIIPKSMYEKDRLKYRPLELLPAEFNDARVASALSPTQRRQQEKRLFLAKRIVDE